MSTPADKLKQAAQRVVEVNEHARRHAERVAAEQEAKRSEREREAESNGK